jgi:hypothetical protein
MTILSAMVNAAPSNTLEASSVMLTFHLAICLP